MTKKHKILAFTAILLLVSSACMAVTGASDSNSNSENKQPQNEIIETEQQNEQNASEDGPGFKSYEGKELKSGGLITNVTLALNTEGENFDPVDPSTEFGPNATIHAVVEVKKAPADTKFTAKWYTTDVGDVDVPNKLIDETETTAEGSGNLDFSLSPTTFFPEGNYRVELYINDKLDTLKEYSIVEGGPELDTSTSNTSDTNYIVSVTMAKGVKGLAKEPVNPTSVFKPADTVHAVVKAEGVPEGTSFTSVWLVTDIGDIAEPDTVVDTMSLDMSGDGNIDFSLAPTKPFPAGTYRVEIQVDGETAWVEEYEIK